LQKPANVLTRDFRKLVISPPAEVVATATATTTTAGSREICARGTSLIDGQRPAIESLAIQASNCPLYILTIGEFDKAEAARGPCHLVANHYGRGHLKACVRYKFTETCISRAMG
jgi:hypothetical protein